jgi:hypothetical protein
MLRKILNAAMAGVVVLCLAISTPARRANDDYKQLQVQPTPICAHLLTELMVGCLTSELFVCE